MNKPANKPSAAPSTKPNRRLKALFPTSLGRLRTAPGLWFEATLILFFALAISFWFSPQDPLGVRAAFPWLLLAPFVIALRYGTTLGVFVSVVLVAVWVASPHLGLGIERQEFPQQYFLGNLILVLIAGQFADIWNSRLDKIKEVNAYLDARLSSLTRNHYLLRLSHERIEQDLLIRPTTLRDLLIQLRTRIESTNQSLPGATDFMRLLAQSCEVECAGLFAFVAETGQPSRWEIEPVAQLADVKPLLLSDPLVAKALEFRQLTHPQADANLDDSRYLVVIPVMSGQKKMLGLVAIERMPFFGLNNENLQLMLVLAGYFADGIESARAIRPVLLLRPDCPPDFALELVRLQRMQDQISVESALVILTVPNQSDHITYFDHLKRQKRSTDLVWEIDTPKIKVWVTLLPLAGSAAIEGFLERLEHSMKQQLSTDFASARVAIHVAMLSSAEPEWMLDDVLNRAGVPLHSNPGAQAQIPAIVV